MMNGWFIICRYVRMYVGKSTLSHYLTQEKPVTSTLNLWAVEMHSIAVFISMRWLCCLRLAIRSDSLWPSGRLMAE